MTSTFNLFNTSIMGMGAQSSALANISENIANANTVGYKDASTNFLTVLNGLQSNDNPGGGVTTTSQYSVASQGALTQTTSPTDLAIQGGGFFVVQNTAGQTLLTRAGSFTPDAQGRLVNAAGNYLMAIPNSSGSSVATNASLSSMSVVQIPTNKLFANASTSGTLSVNLDSQPPTTNGYTGGAPASGNYTYTTSLVAYDNLGTAQTLSVYYGVTPATAATATTPATPATTTMAIYDPTGAQLGSTQTLAFDANGQLTGPSSVSVPVTGGATLNLSIAGTTELASAFAVNSSTVNGNAPSSIASVQVGTDGAMSYLLGNGQTIPAYTIALANVASPTNLASQSGDTFSQTTQSGQIFVGAAGTGSLGNIQSSELESSTVDLATELSNMIIAQRSFTANSQVFQVSSDILQVLNNLK